MARFQLKKMVAPLAVLSGLTFAGGVLTGETAVALAGSAALGVSGATMLSRWQWKWPRSAKKLPATAGSSVPTGSTSPGSTTEDNAAAQLVDNMMRQGRYSLLLRSRIVSQLGYEQWQSAKQQLDREMALVPQGQVVVKHLSQVLADSGEEATEFARQEQFVVAVDQFFLDRYPVTNRQFADFVGSGGYEQAPLWDPAILPALLDFVDSTGVPGPRYWKNGYFLPGEENLPVVGVSWHEALAYARWAGKRLPTDAEWIKAGSWPITLSAANRSQRRYPWGEHIDPRKANLWGSGPGKLADVRSFAEGVSVGGVYGLIGNVWEWTSGDYELDGWDTEGVRLKNIRGGAFDTYFENQASCDFASGENLLSRKHNIGFRCALGACDLALFPPTVKNAAGGADHADPAELDLVEARA